MKLSDCSAVILDMDGLVLDTEKTYFSAWQKALEQLGYQGKESFLSSLSGLEYSEVEARLLAAYGDTFDLESFRSISSKIWYAQVKQHGITVKKGFYELIDVLKKSNLLYALATNSLKKNVLECLAYAGISDYFIHNLATGDSVRLGKPAPDIFFYSASLLDSRIESCVVVEDSDIGIQAAKAAGAFAIHIPSNSSVQCKNADLCLNDLAQLAEIIKDAMR